MPYEAKNFDALLGTEGFSDTLLKNHFTLYQGYVTNTNKLDGELQTLVREGKAGTPAYAELKRRFGWEFNGMRLHELYFGNMKKEVQSQGETPPHPQSALYKKIISEFGTRENAWKELKTVASLRGIGWAILYHDATSGRLFNVWVNEHDVGHLAGATPLLVLDVFEHAYVTDYGLKRADYLEAFSKAIDWSVVEKRLSA